jgi:dTDP-4-amino-4,6-dideoxygalactose transaminase
VDCLRPGREGDLVIPWASPAAQYRAHKNTIEAAIGRVLKSGTYVLGSEVEYFERAFANYCGVAYAIGVGSGTDALILALRGLGISEGDEVITVSHTALATAAAIIAAGATPVLVDVDAISYTIDPARIEEAVTAKTRAIVAVHLYGQPADLDAISAIAKRHGLKLVEDCAQAAGAIYRGRRVGGIGDVACFSFYPTKNLGAIGDGGMITTANAALASRVRRLHQYGWNGVRETEDVGVNSRLDPLQAAILGAKLPHLDADNARRAAIAARYAEGLSGLSLTLPATRERCAHVYHLYVLACDEREALMEHLHRHGVGSGIHYPVPVHLHKGYAERVRVPKEGLPLTEYLVRRVISLPIYPELEAAEIDSVISTLRDFYQA